MIVAEQGIFDIDLPETLDIEGRFLALAERRKELEESLEQVKDTMQAMEPELLAYWLDKEKRTETRAGKTIYLHRSRFATPLPGVGEEQLCAALMDTEMRDLVKYGVNKMSLTARLKEAEEQGGIPGTLDGVVELKTRHSVRYRKA